MNRITRVWFLGLLLVATAGLRAEVKLPSIISDHMALLRAEQTPIWGKADPGERVAVSLNGATVETIAGEDGQWRVSLNLADSPEGPFEMTVSGKNTLTIRDVVVGEVWLASGQSNMEQMMLSQNPEEAATAVNPMLRQFIAIKQMSLEAGEDVGGFWLRVEPGQTDTMSAVGYFFSKSIHEKTMRPVGLIKAAWGGRNIESFISPEAHDSVEDFKASRKKALENLSGKTTAFTKWLQATGRSDRPTVDIDSFLNGDASLANGWVEVKDSGLVSDPALPSYGAVWFRKDIELTASQIRVPQYLFVGFKSADFFSVYLNGKLVERADMEDFTTSSGLNSRIYLMPKDMREGVNQLALRVFAPCRPTHLAWAPFLNGKSYGGGWLGKAEFALPNVPREPGRPVFPPPMFTVGGTIYNGMIQPLAPYALRGVIWYQGESNTRDPANYRKLMPLLIRDWRSHWGNDRLPFYFCQLANWKEKTDQPGESSWAELREAQSMTLSVPDTGMAVLIDTGESKDIHPQSKDIAGERLARIALARTYGKAIPFSGPIYNSMKVEGSRIRISLQHLEGGLLAGEIPPEYPVMRRRGETAPLERNSPNSELEGFAICGADRDWVWAEAKIDGDTVLVWSDKVIAPVAVRYAWAENPTCNLYNQADLPASPFRTDPASGDRPNAGVAIGSHVAVTPAPHSMDWWTARHQSILERNAQGQVDLLMIGDSITHGWGGLSAKAIWEEYYELRNAVNLGYIGDRTENVLWRLQNGEIDHIQPKLALLMIGTNNSNGKECSPEQIADGIKAIVRTLRARLPNTKILILSIFPRGNAEMKRANAPVAAYNDQWAKCDEASRIASQMADGMMIHFLNVNHVFLNEQGELTRDIMPDLLHPKTKGYRLWAEAMEPTIAKLMGDGKDGKASASPAMHAAGAGLFDKSNLAAWCIVPFDGKKRGPKERAAMLKRLGISKFVYDYRAEHIPQWDEELTALKKHDIELLGWWFPVMLNGRAKETLEVFRRHGVTPQLWVSGGGREAVEAENEADQQARIAREVARFTPICKAAAEQELTVGLYNHGGWFGEPENAVAIVKALEARSIENVGIVYNLHHGHSHLDRLPAALELMKPHLLCLNLNGMDIDGDKKGRKILPLGVGTEDAKALRIIRDSGYDGPFGILNHTQEDAEGRLLDNLDGLRWILPQLDDAVPGPRPHYRTWSEQPETSAPAARKSPATAAGVPSLNDSFGKALSGGMTVPGNADYHTLPFTIECRARLDSQDRFNILVACQPKSASAHWELYTHSKRGSLALYLPGRGGDYDSRVNICDGKWHDLAASVSDAGVTLWVDGKKVFEKPLRKAKPVPPVRQVTLAFGRLVEGTLGCDGLIDDVRLSRGVVNPVASDAPRERRGNTLGLWNFDAKGSVR
jgi:lysophospholipase L1-like esterase